MATIFTFWTFLLPSKVIMRGSLGLFFAFLAVKHYLCSRFKKDRLWNSNARSAVNY